MSQKIRSRMSPRPILIDMDDDSARRTLVKYFETMVAFRIAGLVSSLTALQVRLLRGAPGMTPEEMDRELHRLEDMKRSLGPTQ